MSCEIVNGDYSPCYEYDPSELFLTAAAITTHAVPYLHFPVPIPHPLVTGSTPMFSSHIELFTILGCIVIAYMVGRIGIPQAWSDLVYVASTIKGWFTPTPATTTAVVTPNPVSVTHTTAV